MVDPSWFHHGPAVEALPVTDEPAHAYRFGDVTGAPLTIYISHEAARFIEAYVKASEAEELCGLLVGYAGRGSKRPFIVITGAIEAPHTHKMPSGVCFSNATVEYFKRVHRREYPDTIVLGWFHSHPGAGPGLTQFDQFMHHRLFDRPWQVTFAIDPESEASRFYGWDGKRIVPVDAYFVYNPARNARTLQTLRTLTAAATASGPHSHEPPSEGAEARRGRRASRRRTALGGRTGLMIGITALAAITVWAGTLWHGATGNPPAPPEHLTEVQTNASLSTGHLLVPEETASQVPQEVLSAPPDDPGSIPSGERTYVVQPGDTLWSISERFFGNPLRFDAIAAWNQLDDPDRIVPGMSLRLPPDAWEHPASGDASNFTAP